MRNILILIFVNTLLALLSEAFLPNVLAWYFVPNLILAFSLGILFLDNTEKAYLSVFIGGLILDLFGFGIIGENSLILTIILFLVILSRRYFSKSFFANLLTVFLVSIVYRFFNATGFKFELFPFLLHGLITLLVSNLFSKLIKYFRRSNNWIRV